MQVDLGGYYDTVLAAAAGAARAEADGYDGWWAPETQIDALIGAAAAATATQRIAVGTGITVAFARNPMTVAMAANDLQVLSAGRFHLGLGSQVKAHVVRRFSMPWSHPAPRMAEFIAALRAIWAAWETGEKLDFRGDFYAHTLMTPAFAPPPHPHGPPPILLAGVGEKMTATAAEAADGFISHGFQTERYLREVTLPALRAGRARAGKSLEGFDIVLPVFAFASDSETERERGATLIRSQIGFYGSTPAYRPVLDCHGWGDLQDELNALTREDRWLALQELIGPEVLDAFAVIGTPEEVVAELVRRYGDIVTRLQLSLPADLDPDRRDALMAALRASAPA
ncbi:TIGR03617 family F420-dependent LLM class oxidoreductase [Conexibacter sp. DBS9H8]|uniref:TIGR03617 family F420-dependent LLM class oxidoreductase n=1 Tax=Conexibacter sp. DBS9H8 TaxID=2937801 RepID=UPI00200EBE2E|nr:TIGR03617 family F420-dependent LLM class oxidoreductase [Conexibacter sp. DBS9H8]